DNNDGSLYFGRLYVHWTDFANGGIFSTHSDDEGSTWSTPVRMSATTGGVQGAWPAVAPNGDVYSSWVLFGTDTVTIEVVRSTDGGVTWNQVTNPVTDAAAPIDPTATANCFRTALNGNIRYLPSPQIAIGPNGDVHIVYSYDPDGTGPDTIDVFYRRSTDSGATWLPEIRVNDDTSDSDQFFPTLTVGDSNIVSISFYDRRNDPNNLLYEYFQATSPDGGASFLANVQVSDVQSDVTLDGALATCYHGDYDTHIQVAGAAILQWSDDRNNNADTFSDIVALGTDFLVIPDGSTATVCAPADGVLDLDVLQFNGFGEQVTLADSAWPAGLTASFGTNPVTPPNTSQLTISGTGNVAFGSYTLNVTGTSTPSSIVQDADVTLNVFTQTPPVSTLTAPADGSTNVALMPTLTWSAATEADLYDVEIATDSAFQDIVVQEQTSNTTIDVGSSLSSSTVYYWRVRPLNACGQAAFSQVSSFSTVPLPGDCPLGFENDDLAMEDFEAGVGGFTTGGTGSTWALQGASTNSGTMAFMADDVDDVTDQYLITPVYDLPSAADPLNLLFWTRIELEERGGGCFDGGVVEISSDGGATWTRLENEILLEAYDGPISDQFESPLANENAWCNTRDWTRFVVDLSAFAGESVQIRFRLATDISVGDNGWWIDDVSISTCGDGPIVFEDDFEGGSTGAWSSTVP
ncbi:MAG: choice-of-anchor J domain-containing protein, partial [Acidobacteriota bacterium]